MLLKLATSLLSFFIVSLFLLLSHSLPCLRAVISFLRAFTSSTSVTRHAFSFSSSVCKSFLRALSFFRAPHISLISHFNSSNTVGPEGEGGLELTESLEMSTYSGGTEVPCAHGDGVGLTDCRVLGSLAQGDDGGAGDL